MLFIKFETSSATNASFERQPVTSNRTCTNAARASRAGGRSA
jgi:hypothetical protein